jgi:hypothetical protein
VSRDEELERAKRHLQAMRDRMTCGAMEINQAIHDGVFALDESLRQGLDEEDE